MITPEQYNERGAGNLPGLLGIVVTHVSEKGVRAKFEVTPKLMAPNGYLHAGSVVSLADTCTGYGCAANLPAGAIGFTTIELKSNHLGTALVGSVECVSTPVHMGKNTQVWDAVVTSAASGKTIALFRATQMILYPKA
jgi:1,4-dihydroxy-2-naphthoyl-CoA hydrolase